MSVSVNSGSAHFQRASDANDIRLSEITFAAFFLAINILHVQSQISRISGQKASSSVFTTPVGVTYNRVTGFCDVFASGEE